jgi:hypothetical protein
MAASWPGPPETSSCKLGWGNWWNNWKLNVFYALADGYKPAPAGPSPACSGGCLTVSLPGSSPTDVKYIVLVASRALAASGPVPNQERYNEKLRADSRNYLEGENVLTGPNPSVFQLNPPGAEFNDSGVFKREAP